MPCGDARWKAQVVLDPRRGTCLPAECAAVERQDGKPFRPCINSGGEACRAGADNGHVIDAARIDWPTPTRCNGQLVFAGIAQQLSAWAQHDRQVTGVDVKAFDQRLGFRIGLGIEPLTRMAVAAEKALQPKHVAVLGAADDHRSARSRLEKPDATQYQSAHDSLPQLRLCNQQCPELVRQDDQGLHRSLRVGVDESWSAGELSEFAHERSGTVRYDRRAAAQLIMLGNIDFPGQDNCQAGAYLADLCQRLTRGIGADLPEPPHPLDLERLQHGEHLVMSCVDDRLRRYGHSRPAARVSYDGLTTYGRPIISIVEVYRFSAISTSVLGRSPQKLLMHRSKPLARARSEQGIYFVRFATVANTS